MSSLKEYRRMSEDLEVTPSMIQDFQEAGYIVVRGLLDAWEVEKLIDLFENNQEIRGHIFTHSDGDHSKMNICAWNYPGNDFSGLVTRSEKMTGTCEKLLGGEVYLYHTKVMMKEAFTGGSYVWHQDYGYWYKSGNLLPDMMTVFTSLDPCTRENGCLQVLEGSHKCGRIDHDYVGGQQGADMGRVNYLLKKFPHHYVELQPGDAIFFHCNLLHVSNKNSSALRRWAYVNSFNMARNDPVIEHHHPKYNKLHKVPNSALKECANFSDMSGKGFLDNKKADWYDDDKEKEG